MSMTTRICDVRHNAETGCFEANVTLIEGLDSFTYAVELQAPIDTEVDRVKSSLVARARAQHFPSRCALTRRRVDEVITNRFGPDRSEDVANQILLSQPNYLEQILGRHAA